MVLAHNIEEIQRTKDIKISQDITFDMMLLSPDTLKGLKHSGFFKPSPIQLHGIPLGKCGFDILLEAKSGTGKTAVFTIIALEKLDLSKGLQVIILAPTREIAAQICDVLRQIGSSYDDLCVEVVMGGLPFEDDIEKFKNNKVHIVVASPGRLKHLIQDKYVEVTSVRLLVLDEADKLMEKSFINDIKFIHSSLPTQKQVIMSSATYPESCKEYINQFVHGAQHVCPNSNCILLGVTQKVTFVQFNSNIVKQTQNRFRELLKILTKKQFKQCLIFCNYQARVCDLHKMLTREKWPSEQLYGLQDQLDRLDALKTLQEYKCRILISTDLAARGIDASNVDLVINFEPPYEWQTYLHRIGRAGRFGSYGTAITILSEGKEQQEFMNLLESIKVSINLTSLWSEETTDNISDNDAESNVASKESISKPSEENYESIWENICGKYTEIMDNIETFDFLVNSFNESINNNIQSFSDLVDSFENEEFKPSDETNMPKYKYVNTSKLLTNNCFKSMKEIRKKYSLHSIESNSLNRNYSDGAKYNTVYSDNNLKITEYNNNEINKNIASDNSDCNSKKYYKPMQSIITDKDFELDNNTEMLSLGLPEAFSSSKNKPRKVQQKLNTRCSSSKNKCGNVINNTEVDTRHSFSKNKWVNVTNNTELDTRCSTGKYKWDNVTTNSGHLHINQKAKNKMTHIINKYSSQTQNADSNFINKEHGTWSVESNFSYTSDDSIHRNNLNIQKKNTTSNRKRDTSSSRNYQCSSYYNWYKQLKFTTKQIELAYYIDELSKL